MEIHTTIELYKNRFGYDPGPIKCKSMRYEDKKAIITLINGETRSIPIGSIEKFSFKAYGSESCHESQ